MAATYFAEFKTKTGKVLHVNPDHVAYFQQGAETTSLFFNENHHISVTDDAAEVRRKLTGRS